MKNKIKFKGVFEEKVNRTLRNVVMTDTVHCFKFSTVFKNTFFVLETKVFVLHWLQLLFKFGEIFSGTFYNQWQIETTFYSTMSRVVSCQNIKIKSKLGTVIHNTLFSSQLMNGPNKLECYITPGWKGLPGTNTLP